MDSILLGLAPHSKISAPLFAVSDTDDGEPRLTAYTIKNFMRIPLAHTVSHRYLYTTPLFQPKVYTHTRGSAGGPASQAHSCSPESPVHTGGPVGGLAASAHAGGPAPTAQADDPAASTPAGGPAAGAHTGSPAAGAL